MTTDRIMLIVGILMVVGSFGWMAWDLYRKHRAREREFQASLARLRARGINTDPDKDDS